MDILSLHHGTPTLAVIEPRGLGMRGVAYQRGEIGQTPQTRVTREVFDAPGRVVEQWDARLSVPALGNRYSLSGKVMATDSVDAGWRVVLHGQADEVLSEWDSRGSRQDIEYDPLLRTVAVTEQARGQAARVVERFEYGSADLQEDNQCGRVIRHDDPAGTRYMPAYDLLGLAQCEISHFLNSLDPPDWPLEKADRDELLESNSGLASYWAYNSLGELLGLTDAKGHRRHFKHTVAGQLKEGWLQPVNTAAPGRRLVHDIRYNPGAKVERETAGNGVVTEAEYALSDGRLVRLAAGLPNAAPLQDLRYTVNPVGDIVQIDDHALPVRYYKNQRIYAQCTYDYDTLGQLTRATGWEAEKSSVYPSAFFRPSTNPDAVVNYQEEYDYDAAGNMTELRHLGAQSFTRRWVVAPSSNRSLIEDDQPPDFDSHFDDCGNLQFLQRGQAMTWDLRNQLSSVSPVVRDDANDDTERYICGGGGRRLRKVRTAQAAANTVIAEVRYLPGLEIHRGTGGKEHEVLDLEAGRNRVKWLHGPDAPEHPLRYDLTNHLGSGTLELDEQANVQSREEYYPFGGTAWEDHRDQSGAYKTIRYSGKERDATGLYYYGYRYFAPWLSRWINPDPAGAVDGLNLYGFVGNSPVGYVDLDGRVKRKLGDFLAAGGELRDPKDLASDARRARWDFISDALRPDVDVSSAQIENYSNESQSSVGSVEFEELQPFPVYLVDQFEPVGIDEIELAPRRTDALSLASAPASPVAGPSSAILPVSENPNTCPVCKAVSTNKSNLKKHLRVHTGEKPFKCPTCGNMFRQSESLSVHMQTHAGYRRYDCKECGKKFVSQSHLTEHARLHKGERPFSCTVENCIRTFVQSRQLQLHMKTHGPKIRCEFAECSSEFSTQQSLKNHLKRKH